MPESAPCSCLISFYRRNRERFDIAKRKRYIRGVKALRVKRGLLIEQSVTRRDSYQQRRPTRTACQEQARQPAGRRRSAWRFRRARAVASVASRETTAAQKRRENARCGRLRER